SNFRFLVYPCCAELRLSPTELATLWQSNSMSSAPHPCSGPLIESMFPAPPPQISRVPDVAINPGKIGCLFGFPVPRRVTPCRVEPCDDVPLPILRPELILQSLAGRTTIPVPGRGNELIALLIAALSSITPSHTAPNAVALTMPATEFC